MAKSTKALKSLNPNGTVDSVKLSTSTETLTQDVPLGSFTSPETLNTLETHKEAKMTESTETKKSPGRPKSENPVELTRLTALLDPSKTLEFNNFALSVQIAQSRRTLSVGGTVQILLALSESFKALDPVKYAEVLKSVK